MTALCCLLFFPSNYIQPVGYDMLVGIFCIKKADSHIKMTARKGMVAVKHTQKDVGT